MLEVSRPHVDMSRPHVEMRYPDVELGHPDVEICRAREKGVSGGMRMTSQTRSTLLMKRMRRVPNHPPKSLANSGSLEKGKVPALGGGLGGQMPRS